MRILSHRFALSPRWKPVTRLNTTMSAFAPTGSHDRSDASSSEVTKLSSRASTRFASLGFFLETFSSASSDFFALRDAVATGESLFRRERARHHHELRESVARVAVSVRPARAGRGGDRGEEPISGRLDFASRPVGRNGVESRRAWFFSRRRRRRSSHAEKQTAGGEAFASRIVVAAKCRLVSDDPVPFVRPQEAHAQRASAHVRDRGRRVAHDFGVETGRPARRCRFFAQALERGRHTEGPRQFQAALRLLGAAPDARDCHRARQPHALTRLRARRRVP
mmetsp:Transcript_9574/g.40112  ORF Transcript_9574/g.40112 Transcript_9574/m.40112 type:complete len:280 (-) Transcript_9574:1-840(-)